MDCPPLADGPHASLTLDYRHSQGGAVSDSTPGRALITVAPNDTLDQVLESLRATAGIDVVLEVDQRSPLLISLAQLHRLDEVAQAHGIEVAIASANSTLLNAARVFGLAIIDLRDGPLPAPPAADAPPRLLAGQPLGDALDAEPEGPEEEPDAAPPLRQRRVIQLSPPPRSPEAVDDDRPDAAWEMPAVEPSSARPARGVPDGAADPPRLDPYGQPYGDDLDEDDEDVAPRRERRGIAVAGWAATPDAVAGWDEDGEPGDESAYADEREPQPRPWQAQGGFWSDVRAWMAARRGTSATAPPPDREDLADGEPPDEEGWDEPPYRARQVAASGVAEPGSDADEGIDEVIEPEYPSAPPAREIGRSRSARQSGEHTARLPVITSAIAYDAAESYDAAYDTDEEEYAEVVDDEGWSRRDRPAGTGHFALGSLAFTLLIIGLLVAIVLYLLLPTATVTLAARTGQLQTEFRVVVGEIDPSSPDGQPTSARIVVPAKRITVPLNAAVTRPATGARLEPDVTAGGTVVLTNPSRTAVSVAKGTTLAAIDGRSYSTTEAITIGPADPFGSGAFGSGTVKVAANIQGSGGNAAIGVVQGQLENGLYYTNKTAPIAGGSDRRIPTISEQDRAAAQEAAEEAARAKGQAALTGAFPAGSTPMRDTTGVGNFRVKFNAAEGADGESVTATVTAEATALVYTPGDVEAQARAEAERRLTAQVKPGEPIVAGSVQISAPQVVEDLPGQLTYAVTGGAQTRAVLGSEEERERLAQDLAHKDDADARALLNALPGVASSSIQYQTGPFPERMPWLPSHIQVQVQGAGVR